MKKQFEEITEVMLEHELLRETLNNNFKEINNRDWFIISKLENLENSDSKMIKKLSSIEKKLDSLILSLTSEPSDKKKILKDSK